VGRSLAAITPWRNSSVNRSLQVYPYEAYTGRKPQYAYDRLGLIDVVSVTPSELANICACVDTLVQTAAAVSSAQYYSKRTPPVPNAFASGSAVLVYFPDRESKTLTLYSGPFEVLPQAEKHGNSTSATSDPAQRIRGARRAYAAFRHEPHITHRASPAPASVS
jgi:hypothetical protein